MATTTSYQPQPTDRVHSVANGLSALEVLLANRAALDGLDSQELADLIYVLNKELKGALAALNPPDFRPALRPVS